MKTKEQIEQAQDIVRNLQDYVELAKTEKKMKVKDNQNQINDLLDKVTKYVKDNVEVL